MSPNVDPEPSPGSRRESPGAPSTPTPPPPPSLSSTPPPAAPDDYDIAGYRPDQLAQERLDPRRVVRLLQCRVCSHPLREPVSLPCGRSICRKCLPETHHRSNITYPASPERLRGFHCPLQECGVEHSVGDCSVDVVLNKAAQLVREEIERPLTEEGLRPHVSTKIIPQDPWVIAGISSLREDETGPQVIQGGKLAATYALAEAGRLKYDVDVTYDRVSSPSESDHAGSVEDEFNDDHVLRRAQAAARTEMDCQICYSLFYDPLTSSCGHTFCRSCLHRILDHSRYCPICRRPFAINPLLNRTSCPSNDTLTKITEAFWLPELNARRDMLYAERTAHLQDYDFPLFVCTLSFPTMPTFLHVFEPRYRLMIRRVMEGSRTFGMALPNYSRTAQGPDFHEFGTLLRVVNVQYYADGRSLIETVGVSRFRVTRHATVDGYTVVKAERVDDVSLQEEEALEAAEALSSTPTDQDPPPQHCDEDKQAEPPLSPGAIPHSPTDIDRMSTESLMHFGVSFVTRMSAQSAPWLTERMLGIYGECPDDAAVFPWWFASILPVKDLEKYRLLATSSVRDRLKICCSWIYEWETYRWSLHGCRIL